MGWLPPQAVRGSHAVTAPFWEVHGGRGPYLLLIHGFLSSRAQWTPNIDALRDVCQPVTMELYGHGRSPVPDSPDCYTPRGYAGAIDAIREHLATETWFVCGYSLGAAISIRYALDYPHRVRGHIFTNSSSAFSEPRITDAWRANASESAARLRAGGRAALERLALHPKRAKRLPRPVHEALIEDAERISPEAIANTMQSTLPAASVRDELQHNSRPALLVCGRFEKRFAPHRVHAAAVMPGLSVEEVDTGHAVNMAAPDAFNAHVRAFIEAH